MTKPLRGLSVLIVEDDADAADMLTMALQGKGAECRQVESGAEAIGVLRVIIPDVILCDLALPDGSGLEWLPKFRAMEGMTRVPAIAISGHGARADRAATLAAGFEKHLLKPASLVDIVAAVTTVTNMDGALGLRPTLSRLARTTGCRYTSFLRFDRGQLVSVWTFDRENETTDAFPLKTPLEASYCALVKAAGDPIVIENAATDPRTVGHPRQHDLATYAGAPVFDRDGSIFGTLCTYDETPRTIDEEAQHALAAAAKELESAIR